MAAVAAAIVIAFMAWWRLDWARNFMLPVGYGAPIVVVAWFRSRRILWLATAAFVLLTVYKFFIYLPAGATGAARNYDIGSGVLVLVDIALVAAIAHIWILTQGGLEQ